MAFPVERHDAKAYSVSWMGLCKPFSNRPVRRLDVKVYMRKTYPCAWLYFTGSANFNGALRQYACTSLVQHLAEQVDRAQQREHESGKHLCVVRAASERYVIPQSPNSFKLDDNTLLPVWRQ